MVRIGKNYHGIIRSETGVVRVGSRSRDIIAVVRLWTYPPLNGDIGKTHVGIGRRETVFEVEGMHGHFFDLRSGKVQSAIFFKVNAVNGSQIVIYTIHSGV